MAPRKPIAPGDVFGTVSAIRPHGPLIARKSRQPWQIRCRTCGWEGIAAANALQNLGLPSQTGKTGCGRCRAAKAKETFAAADAARTAEDILARQLASAVSLSTDEAARRRRRARALRAEEFTLREIADTLGVSVRTVRWYLLPTLLETLGES